MNAMVRTISPHDAVSFEGMDRRKAARPLVFLSDRNFGGATASFGLQSLHQFFGQAGKSDPHTRLSQTVLSRKGTMGETNLMRTQKSGDLQNSQNLKAADYVAEAAQWADKLTNDAEQTHGSKEAALEAVARKTGVNHSTLWSLRYRKPKDIAVSIYMKLKGAYERELMRQEGLLRHDNEIRRAKVGNADSLVVKTDAFLSSLNQSKGE